MLIHMFQRLQHLAVFFYRDGQLVAVLHDGCIGAQPDDIGHIGHIAAVQEEKMMKKIVRMNAAVMGAESNPYYGAPTVILVFAPKDRNTYIEDGSCVLDTMMLAAHSIGLASRWIHREREMFETEEGRELMKKWGIPENFAGIGALALGYADCEIPEPPARKEGRIIYDI